MSEEKKSKLSPKGVALLGKATAVIEREMGNEYPRNAKGKKLYDPKSGHVVNDPPADDKHFED